MSPTTVAYENEIGLAITIDVLAGDGFKRDTPLCGTKDQLV